MSVDSEHSSDRYSQSIKTLWAEHRSYKNTELESLTSEFDRIVTKAINARMLHARYSAPLSIARRAIY